MLHILFFLINFMTATSYDWSYRTHVLSFYIPMAAKGFFCLCVSVCLSLCVCAQRGGQLVVNRGANRLSLMVIYCA